jgi:hypothetical protein
MPRAGKRTRSLSEQAAALDVRKRAAPAPSPEEAAARVEVLGEAARRLTAARPPPSTARRSRKKS